MTKLLQSVSHAVRSLGLAATILFSLLGAEQSPARQAPANDDKRIQDKLAAPPLFLDEKHPGPTLVPNEMPAGIFPFDCRAVEAYLHRVRPGQYHFERAQRLLGQGIDVIGCEAFGLDRFHQAGDDLLRLEQAAREAEMAAAIPIGLEQWRSGATDYVLESAYADAAKAFARDGEKRNLPLQLQKGRDYTAKLNAVRRLHHTAPNMNRRPLMEAVLKNDPKTVAALIDGGTNVNSTDIDHTSALRLAVVTGNADIVKLLLARGALMDTTADEEGVTSLMDACAIGRFDIAAVLVEGGANVNARADDGSGPLLDAIGHMALNGQAKKSRLEFTRFLITKGADVNSSDWFGTTPLIRAATSGNEEIVNVLLDHSAAIDAVDNDGDNSLIHAVKSDAVTTAATLIRRRARLDLFNKRGDGALILAAKNGYPEGVEITRMLLRAGADPNQSSPNGWTPLMSAEGFNYKEPWGVSSHLIVRELLALHVNVNARSKEGTSPLIVAAGHMGPDDDSFIEELVRAGAEVNASDEDGETALMSAAELGHVKQVQFLLSHGANAKAQDKVGKTALDYARPPRDDNDDEFPQCYDSIDSSRKKTNDCKTTRAILRSAMHR